MGVSSPNEPSKIQTFYLLSWTHEIFEVSKYKEKIKFYKILGYQNGVPPKLGRQNSNFSTTHATT